MPEFKPYTYEELAAAANARAKVKEQGAPPQAVARSVMDNPEQILNTLIDIYGEDGKAPSGGSADLPPGIMLGFIIALTAAKAREEASWKTPGETHTK